MNPPEFRIAFVGRPNVGKSSLFNALLGYRRTIVLDMPGTTMDEVYERVKWSTEPLGLVDSQGIFDEGDKTVLEKLLKTADACLFVVDATTGPTPFDRWVATILHQVKKPVLVCVNKVEGKRTASESEFAELGFDDVLGVSAAHRMNMSAIKDWCTALVDTEEVAAVAPAEMDDKGELAELYEGLSDVPETPTIIKPVALALIGRPNSGKSTLMNRLCQSAVSRVSPTPLTTRDPVTFELDTPQGKLRLIDTAGMRRPRSAKEQVEIFSVQASTRAIREADVVFLLVNCHEGITDQDMRLLNLLVKEGKPAVVLLNFWDLLGSSERKKFLADSEFSRYLEAFRCLPMSGLDGFNVQQCVPLVFRMHKQANRRIKTSKLNKVVETIVARNPPPAAGRQNFNILYASQVRVDPPTFVFFMNRKAALPVTYKKYIENQLRDRLGFKGQAVRVLFRGDKDRA